jgi:hypothetical protein
MDEVENRHYAVDMYQHCSISFPPVHVYKYGILSGVWENCCSIVLHNELCM